MTISKGVIPAILLCIGGCGQAETSNAVIENTVANEVAAPAVDEVTAALPAAAPSPAPSAEVADRKWLVGAWVAEGGHCAGADAMILDADGSFAVGYDMEGRWELNDERLTIISRGVDDDGNPTGADDRSTNTVVRVSANEMRLGKHINKRCPANGGEEPWHPGQRFTTK